MIDLFQICFAICVVVRYMVIIERWNRRGGINQSLIYVAGIDSLLIDTYRERLLTTASTNPVHPYHSDSDALLLPS